VTDKAYIDFTTLESSYEHYTYWISRAKDNFRCVIIGINHNIVD